MLNHEMLDFDRDHIWHPYTSMTNPLQVYGVEKAEGVKIYLNNGHVLIDGMSSWWSAIHGYNHPEINRAIIEQSKKTNHIMFGGLTHEPAINLAKLLLKITPQEYNHIFFADSGSIAVEVALKMAIQYHQNCGNKDKTKFLSLRNGYHGDTFAAMSVSDPENGMHSLFADSLITQYHIPAPTTPFNEPINRQDKDNLESYFEQHHNKVAGLILEPIVQGAGGMRFYSAEFIEYARKLCDKYDVLLILDEIATGFGRTGKLFAQEYTNIKGDILCIGKALTGGQMTLAATLSTTKVAETVSLHNNVLMHGPTFMANPLACAVALKSTQLLLESDWKKRISNIEKILKEKLFEAKKISGVADVRVLGAIGVIELKENVDMKRLQPMFVDAGIWIRPFGKLIYTMPPYIISDEELSFLCEKMIEVVRNYLD